MNLFAYGIIQSPDIQESLFDRVIEDFEPAYLKGYALCSFNAGLSIRYVTPDDDEIACGILYRGLTQADIERADRLEQNYLRVEKEIQLSGGRTERAWVYVRPPREMSWSALQDQKRKNLTTGT
jgi:Gamma-glutamyl cyclotransferase, AIG2-like